MSITVNKNNAFYREVLILMQQVCVDVFNRCIWSITETIIIFTSSSSSGRLKMYYSSQWTPFTIVGFDMHDADLACKSLGYSYAQRYANVAYLEYV